MCKLEFLLSFSKRFLCYIRNEYQSMRVTFLTRAHWCCHKTGQILAPTPKSNTQTGLQPLHSYLGCNIPHLAMPLPPLCKHPHHPSELITSSDFNILPSVISTCSHDPHGQLIYSFSLIYNLKKLF